MTLLAVILGAAVWCAPAPIPTSYAVGSTVVLDPAICRSLRAAPRDDGFGSMATFVLAHELGHVADVEPYSGLPSERRADCWAAENFLAVARIVGYHARTAVQLRREARAFTRSTSYGSIPRRCWR